MAVLYVEVVHQCLLKALEEAGSQVGVCWVFEIRTQGVEILEFQDRHVRVILSHQLFVRSTMSTTSADASSLDRADLVEGSGHRLTQPSASVCAQVITWSEENDMHDHRRGRLLPF